MRLLGLLEATERVCTLVQGDDSVDISSVAIDSRKVKPGCLFMALPGSRIHGYNFLMDAVERGAGAALVPEQYSEEAAVLLPASFPLLSSTNVRRAAGLISHYFFGRPSAKLKVIGITGTNGKTTCSYIIEAILNASGKKTAISGTICRRIGNSETVSCLTTPDCVSFHAFLKDALDQGAEYVVAEVSSHALDQGRVEGCKFAVALFTNLTRDHLDYHGSFEEYFRAKATLFNKGRTDRRVINLDDPYGRRLYEETTVERLSYSLSAEGADITATDFSLGPGGIRASLRLKSERLDINSPLIGRHNLSNILAAASVAISLDVSLSAVKKGIESVRFVHGRLEPIFHEGITGFVDYAHTPDAVRSVLGSLNEIKENGKVITVIGCGGDRDRGKRPEMARIAAMLSDVAILTSDNPRTENPSSIIDDMLSGVPRELAYKVRVMEDRQEAIYWGCSHARAGDMILVAGKGHENYQIFGTKRCPFYDKKVLSRGLKLAALAKGPYNSQALFGPTLENVRKVTGGNLADRFRLLTFDSISTDSRTIKQGDLFWALRGERFDGGLFVETAFEAGALAAVCENAPEGVEARPVIVLGDTLFGLGQFASWYRRFLGIKTIAVTGSCGKTTTKDLVFSVVSRAFRAGATKGNFNNLVGLPLTIFSMEPGTEWAVLEMGTNMPGEIKRLCQIAQPEIGILTCVRPVHLEGLGSLENIAREKGFVLEALPDRGKAIVNLDDELVVRGLERTGARNVWGFGTKEKALSLTRIDHAVIVTGWKMTGNGLDVILDADGKEVEVNSRLIGRANVLNIAAAFCVGMSLGISTSSIAEGIQECSPPKGRMNREDFGGWVLLDDSYNANPSSMEAALGSIPDLAPDLAVNLVLGDMLELGHDSEKFHAELGKKAASVHPSVIVAIGKMARYVARGAMEAGFPMGRIYTFEDSNEAAGFLREEEGIFFNGTPRVVLLKGSRGVRLEEVAGAIRERLVEGT